MKNLILFLLPVLFFASPPSKADDKELKKLAHNLYISEQYAEAARLFYQLMQTDTANRMNYYYYGVSLLQSGGSRTESIKFLESSLSDPNVPALVHYYLAKAHQFNNQFDKAIDAYQRFKLSANPIYVEELKVDEQLSMCTNALTAVENKTDITLEFKQETTLSGFALHYNEQSSKSRLLPVPDRIRKGRSKEKFSSFLFVDETGKWLSYSGPGKNSGKEIYIASRKNSNEWHEAVPVKFEKPFLLAAENPVVTENGTQLHFACNAFNSMGGYDVYESQWDAVRGIWTYPRPLPVPVNSPADEMIFIPMVKEKKAVLLSNLNSAVNQTGVYYMAYPFPQAPGRTGPLASQTEKKQPQPETIITAKPAATFPESLSEKQSEEAMIPSVASTALAPKPNSSSSESPLSVQETKITLTGFFYDVSGTRLNGFPELVIKTRQGIYRSSIRHPSGEFSVTVPANQHYEIALEGSIRSAWVEITLKEHKDSCTIVLLSKKSTDGYTLAAALENENKFDHHYAVQLGAFREKTESEILAFYRSRGMRQVEIVTRQDLKIAVSGNQLSLTDALKVRKELIQSGFSDAFIVMRKGHEVSAPDWNMAMLR